MYHKYLRLLFSGLILSSWLLLSSFTPADTIKAVGFKLKTVVIDAGHGGKDGGAKGSFSNEKTVALSIAKKLQQAMQAQMPDIATVMTRSDDTFIELNRRSAIANQNQGNLFVSIHCNSSPEGTAYRANKKSGVMLLVYGMHRLNEQQEAVRENASIFIEKNYQEKYQSYDESDPANVIILKAFTQKYRKQSVLFGELLNNEFTNNDGRPSIGVKEQGVYVLAHSAMPAVLIETGFINNPDEEEYLNSDEGQQQIVQSIIRAIQAYRASLTAQ
ncbi:N-acetylmuramoyl-L-alanine amidase [Mucilaginibacter pallidiroseus]|uniref:N-acetylmuramoyl-L-alanine amidase n=1 Tax=Mucilaginibacter pallidiroseus TaxID=2599295 RepID=A0A563U206_9SPHI|nr:N-acetylmuramoyl-L-alanine amidase [Mucilaginibacter pallidiroseus]TWR25242.1 N-acetylmuramoyl-L-alanine amidase [Mucilaginibacter pallidiroseus]